MEHRVSYTQMEELLEYLATHRVLVKGAGLGARSKEAIDREWQILAQRLNAHGSGASKTAMRWKRYWADLKHKVKARASAKRQDHYRTGGGPSAEAPLTEIEKKVLSIIGDGAIYGDIEHAVPAFDYEDLPQDSPIIVIETEETQHLPPAVANTAGSYTQGTQKTPPMLHVGQNQIYAQKVATPSKSGSTNPNTPVPSPYKGSPTPKRLGKLNIKKASAQGKSNTKLDSSWIVDLERRRVKAEQKLADAALITAEAAKVQSDAALLMAEAAKVKADSINKLTETCTKILEYLIKKQ